MDFWRYTIMNVAIAYPSVLINQYLAEKVVQYLPDRYDGPLRFFPAQPTDVDTLTESFPDEAHDVFAIYDKLFKPRRRAFPHIKNEQTIYYFQKTNGNPEALFETLQILHDLLDRGDESAQEINAWVSSKTIGDTVTFGSGSLARDFKPVFFHNMKVIQLEESRDINNFKTIRTVMSAKVIIEYEYHIPQDFNNTPLPLPDES
jgi:hypothetical protein